MQLCPACRSTSPIGARFCDECGGALSGGGAAPRGVGPAAPAAPDRRVTIGRDAQQDIVIAAHQTQVARQQAIVSISSGRTYIEDANSANGTYVNGQKVVGRQEFTLTDDVRFGSFTFNTARIQPFVGQMQFAPRVQPFGAPVMQTPQPMQHRAPAAPVRAHRRTFLDGAFEEEGSWMPQLLLVYGIILLGLFFFPMGQEGDRTITAIQLLGNEAKSGWAKLTLATLPIVGIAFILLRTLKAGKTVVGTVLLASVFPAVGGLGSEMFSELGSHAGWRVAFFWISLSGTTYALMYFGSRPRDPLARVLIGIFGSALALMYLLPVDVGPSESKVMFAAIVDGMKHSEQGATLLLSISLLPFFMAFGALWFLVPGAGGGRQREAAQHLGLILGLTPAVGWFLGLIGVAIKMDEGGVLFSAIWGSLYSSFCFLLPAMGATLLTLGIRKKSSY